MFDRNVAAARLRSVAATDQDMASMWTLLQAGNPIFTIPRSAVVRTVVLNHMIHHRDHLCVYLRLNDIPVPGMYGPSGDESRACATGNPQSGCSGSPSLRQWMTGQLLEDRDRRDFRADQARAADDEGLLERNTGRSSRRGWRCR